MHGQGLDLLTDANFLHSLFDQINDGVILYNQDGNILHYNKNALDLINEQIENKNIKQLSLLNKVEKNSLFSPTPKTISLQYKHTDHENSSLYQIQIKPLSWQNNEYFSLFLNDKTEEFSLTEKLQEVQKKLEEESNLKALIWAKTAHEIRTPMHNILSYAQLGSERASKMSGIKNAIFFERIFEHGNRLMDFLNNILALSRLEMHNKNCNMEEIELLPIIEECLDEFQSVMLNKNISFIVSKPRFPTTVVINKFQIAQVFRNLISNALKFSPVFSKCEICFANQTIGENKALEISINDQGPGVLIHEKEKIFEKFVQGSNCNNSNGSGLGLSICKEIIKNHNGRIWVSDNLYDRGSSFKILLPRKKS